MLQNNETRINTQFDAGFIILDTFSFVHFAPPSGVLKKIAGVTE
jgi:hypothetical protein